MGAKDVVLKLGEQGAYWAGPEGEEHFPAFPIDPVDTTAAGDIFNGTLAVGLAEGKPLLEAARFASAAAAISVTRMGAQTSAPKRREIEQLLASRRGR